MQAFILAGGFATRLWPLTESRAKPLLPLAGKPIITHLIEKIPEGLPMTVSTNALFEEGFQIWKKTLGRKNLTIVTERTHSDDEKLGALGATAQWIKDTAFQDDLLLLTGDNYFGCSLETFLETSSHDVPLLAIHNIGDKNQAKHFGTVILAPDGKAAAAFEEKPMEPRSSLISTGCSLIPQSVLPTLLAFAEEHPDNVGGVFEEFLRKGIPLECFEFKEPWFDIGTFESYLEATKVIVGESLHVEEGTMSPGPDTNLQGSVVIGKGSSVQNSRLRDSVLFENCTVQDCTLERCILDNNCTLKGIDLKGKMLRKGTTLVCGGKP